MVWVFFKREIDKKIGRRRGGKTIINNRPRQTAAWVRNREYHCYAPGNRVTVNTLKISARAKDISIQGVDAKILVWEVKAVSCRD